MPSRDREFSFTIVEHFCVLSSSGSGWAKEVNLISWNGNKPKLDIREWDSQHQRMKKGITLRNDEAERLVKEVYGYLKRVREAEIRQGTSNKVVPTDFVEKNKEVPVSMVEAEAEEPFETADSVSDEDGFGEDALEKSDKEEASGVNVDMETGEIITEVQ